MTFFLVSLLALFAFVAVFFLAMNSPTRSRHSVLYYSLFASMLLFLGACFYLLGKMHVA